MTIACLDQTLPSPAENLACEEALLDERAELGSHAPGVLRFWESPSHFVVLGFANKVAAEVHLDACRAAGVPVLRRCSGGGTVLQGAGCLNYALILPSDETGPLASITGANRFIMERHCAALAALLHEPVTVEGHTDLALHGRKFSGNAQRRKREWLLFHGTFLLDFDLSLPGRFLRPPPRPPEYRQGRSHEDFLTSLNVARDDLKSALVCAWQAKTTPCPALPAGRIHRLVAEKYDCAGWILSR